MHPHLLTLHLLRIGLLVLHPDLHVLLHCVHVQSHLLLAGVLWSLHHRLYHFVLCLLVLLVLNVWYVVLNVWKGNLLTGILQRYILLHCRLHTECDSKIADWLNSTCVKFLLVYFIIHTVFKKNKRQELIIYSYILGVDRDILIFINKTLFKNKWPYSSD